MRPSGHHSRSALGTTRTVAGSTPRLPEGCRRTRTSSGGLGRGQTAVAEQGDLVEVQSGGEHAAGGQARGHRPEAAGAQGLAQRPAGGSGASGSVSASGVMPSTCWPTSEGRLRMPNRPSGRTTAHTAIPSMAHAWRQPYSATRRSIRTGAREIPAVPTGR